MTEIVAKAMALYKQLPPHGAPPYVTWASVELGYLLCCMNRRESDQYYQAVQANRDALKRAEESTEWVEILGLTASK